MKLICSKYGLSVELKENQILVLSVESATIFSELVQSLWCQVNGSEGEFLISDREKTYPIPKVLEFIANPFSVNCNGKKVLTGLYKELSYFSIDELQEESETINGSIVSYLDKVCSKVPYALEYQLEFDPVDLYKLYDVHVDSQPSTLLEKVEDYVRVLHQILHIKVFAFLNIKQFFSTEELKEFYKFCAYEKVYIILLERFYDFSSDEEKHWILDKDLCLIEAN